MKPFNIEAAKRGEKLITRDGRSVRILAFDAKNTFPIVALVKNGSSEEAYHYAPDGRYFLDRGCEKDLFMAERSRYIYHHSELKNLDASSTVQLPFDLEAAKAGALMVTRSGDLAWLIKSDCKGDTPLVAIVYDGEEEFALNFTLEGRASTNKNWESVRDLFMVGVQSEGNY